MWYEIYVHAHIVSKHDVAHTKTHEGTHYRQLQRLGLHPVARCIAAVVAGRCSPAD